MKRIAFLTLAVIGLLTAFGHAQEPKQTVGPSIEMPATMAGKVGRAAVIDIKTTAKDLAWEVIAPPGAEFEAFREYSDAATFRLRVTTYGEGAYYLIVAGALGDKVIERKCVITVGESVGPQEATVSATAFKKLQKDVAAQGADIAAMAATLNQLVDAVNALSKKPPPVDPPTPLDPFTASVAKAFSNETDPNRREQMAALAKLFRDSPAIVQDMSLKTSGDVLVRMHEKEKKEVGDDKLKLVRDAIRIELNWALGADLLPLTTKARTTIATTFARVEAAITKSLEVVK
jgi:hypothetical protein